jgi:hypothetical protein
MVPELCPTTVKILTHLISRYQLPLKNKNVSHKFIFEFFLPSFLGLDHHVVKNPCALKSTFLVEFHNRVILIRNPECTFQPQKCVTF